MSVLPLELARIQRTRTRSSGTIIQLQSENEDLRRKHQELTRSFFKRQARSRKNLAWSFIRGWTGIEEWERSNLRGTRYIL